MQRKKLRVLMIDDDAVDAELAERALSKIGDPGFDLTRAETLAEAEALLRGQKFDVALLDLGLPDSQRHETLRRFREVAGGKVSVVVLTGVADENTAFDALEHGAQDYLSKVDVTPELLSRTVRYALQRQRLFDQIESANGELERKNQRLADLCETAQQFVENVSHEFRTPLTVIREFTSIIRDGLDGPVTATQAEHLEKILLRTDDLALMVDDMLDISKLEAGLMGAWRRPANVSDLLENVRGFLDGRAKSKSIQLRISATDNLPEVYCDDEKVRRVLINLAVNAIKFTPDGGAVELWAKSNGEEVVIGVTDTGPGISNENLALIFDRFRQVDTGMFTSVKGFGLGLNIAKELIALNLGTIDVESQVGAGTTFSFTLPKNDAQAVFTRYVDRFDDQNDGEQPLLLLTVETNPPIDVGTAPVVDEFLQRSLRGSDLVARFGNGPWVILAPCGESNSARIAKRLHDEWTEFSRNFPLRELPNLIFQHVNTWAMPRERTELQKTFMSINTIVPPPKATKRKVLVVDDDHEVSQCLSVRLQSAGYEVISAADGEAGLDAAWSMHPDAIVLDVRMPKKDGLEVLKELRASESMKTTPIVMLSASIRDQHRALEAGASYFVPKPYEARQVLTAIESSMREEVSK